MSTFDKDVVERLLSKYDFKDSLDCVGEDLTCTKCKKLMSDAYETSCGCNYCRKCISHKLKYEHKFCVGGKVECKDEYLVMETNVLRSARINRKISQIRVKCPNELCTSEIELGKMEEHLRMCVQQSLGCPYSTLGCGDGGGSPDSLSTHLHDDTFTHTKLLLDFVHNLKNEITDLKDNSEKTDENITLLKNETRMKINKLEEKVEMIVNEMKLRKTVDVMSFTVFNFSQRKYTKEAIFSPYFSSHNQGYKLQLKVYPGGIGDGCGTHVSVFFTLCKGEYDNLLSWPCKHYLKISIVNQLTGETNNSQIFNYSAIEDGYKYVFNKPANGDNACYGQTTFICHEDLQALQGVIVHDSFIIKCSIRSPI